MLEQIMLDERLEEGEAQQLEAAFNERKGVPEAAPEPAAAAPPAAPGLGGPERLGDTNLAISTANQIVDTSDATVLSAKFGTTDLQSFALRLGIDESGSKREIAARVRQAVIDKFRISDTQDFGNIEITFEVEVAESGETVEVTELAQTMFARESTRLKNLNTLLDCVRG